MLRCISCQRAFPSSRSLKLHYAKSKCCHELWEHELSRPLQSTSQIPVQAYPVDDPLTIPDAADHQELCTPPSPYSPVPLPIPQSKSPQDTIGEGGNTQDACKRYPVTYPGAVASVLGIAQTTFEGQREEQERLGKSPWSPFEDDEEWGLAE